MSDSLLSHITDIFIPQYENVANSSTCYLLNKYPAAHKALMSIAGLKYDNLIYEVELATDANGRPDITGLDDGKKVVIIEGKFWASLTNHQPLDYLKELRDAGVLIFIAPEARRASLKATINEIVEIQDKDRIKICSWLGFLKKIESMDLDKRDSNLKSDLIQIKKLCGKMDVEGMPPLTGEDLDPMHGRIVYHFLQVLDDCETELRRWKDLDFQQWHRAHSNEESGYYFMAHGFGFKLLFSNLLWFKENACTPFWLSIQDKDWKKSGSIKRALLELEKRGNRVIDEKDRSLYGITLEAGMDKEKVVRHITERIKVALDHIKISCTD
jgi:hypothetical protein